MGGKPGKNWDSKFKFLEALSRLFTPRRACEELKLRRTTYEAWMQEDPAFRRKVEAEEANLKDRIKEIALVKLKMIPGQDPEQYRKVSDTLITAFWKRDTTQIEINAIPAPIEIKGLTSEMLAAVSPIKKSYVGKTHVDSEDREEKPLEVAIEKAEAPLDPPSETIQ